MILGLSSNTQVYRRGRSDGSGVGGGKGERKERNAEEKELDSKRENIIDEQTGGRWARGDAHQLHGIVRESTQRVHGSDDDGGEGEPDDRKVDASSQHVGLEMVEGQQAEVLREDRHEERKQNDRDSNRRD
eukprot:564039-Rhodomonas_salina.1